MWRRVATFHLGSLIEFPSGRDCTENERDRTDRRVGGLLKTTTAINLVRAPCKATRLPVSPITMAQRRQGSCALEGGDGVGGGCWGGPLRNAAMIGRRSRAEVRAAFRAVLRRSSEVASGRLINREGISSFQHRPRMIAKRNEVIPSMQCWLFKSEPESFSIQDLLAAPKKRTFWDGVRNYQARNMLRDAVRVGDLILFHHSSSDPSGIAGTARVVKAASPDPTAFDPKDPHFDPKSSKDDPTWFGVEIEATRVFEPLISLAELRAEKALMGMELLKRGSRLSIQPVTPEQWSAVLALRSAGAAAGLNPQGEPTDSRPKIKKSRTQPRRGARS